MNLQKLLPAVLVSALGFAAAASAGAPPPPPSPRIGNPWYQVRQAQAIPAGAHVSIQVTGKTATLPGEELLLQTALSGTLGGLLARRGYAVVTENPDFIAQAAYETVRREETHFPAEKDDAGNPEWLGDALPVSGWGVMAARMAEIAAPAQAKVTFPDAPAVTRYLHTVSLEFFDSRGAQVWKGDVVWESNGPDIGRDIVSSFQFLLAALPSTGDVIPQVRKVRAAAGDSYWAVNVNPRWFACPALPHKIYPQCPDAPKGLAAAMEAAADLMQTAEFAVPDGKENYDAPLDAANWTKVVLGGKYLLGGDTTPVNILISLEDSPAGYMINRCRVVTDADYAKFTQRLEAWKMAISGALGMYETPAAP